MTIFSGCPAEVDELNQTLTVSGTVTYQGKPLKMAAIHFLPTVAGGLPASGAIADGQIKGVYTRTPGDGIKPGRYRIAIMAFNEAFLETTTKRDFQGPDPKDVARGFEHLKNQTFPNRYSNSMDSGLVEEISPDHHTIHLELTD